MSNKRVYYACQGVSYNGAPLAGLQTVSTTTDQSVIPIDEFGSLDVLSIPNQPKISINLSRTLDSSNATIYSGTLENNINNHTNYLCLFIGQDTFANIYDDPASVVDITYNYLSLDSISYTFDINGNFTEDASFIGYSKETGACPVTVSSLVNLPSTNNIKRRQHISFPSGLPSPINIGANIINITINANFNVNTIEEFGKNIIDTIKKYRYSALPIEISCDIEVIYTGDNNFDGYLLDIPTSFCDYSGLSNNTNIYLDLCGKSITINNCLLRNISYDGGGTDGSNVSIKYSYVGYNHLTII